MNAGCLWEHHLYMKDFSIKMWFLEMVVSEKGIPRTIGLNTKMV
jgi:hypothetical protein